MAAPSSTTPTDETLYREVIVGVDGAAGGRDAAALARVLGHSARTTLVYVRLFNPAGDHPTMLAIDRADDGDALGEALAQERRLATGSPACVRVPGDSVAEGLDAEAARRDADLIVVGASHRHGLARLLWGDDALALVHRSPTAIAVAPSGYAHVSQPPRRIGVVDDATSGAQVALAHAGLLSRQFAAELHVRRIESPPLAAAQRPNLVPGASSRASRARDHDIAVGEPTVEITLGPVGAELRELATEVDLIVFAAHREGVFARLLVGSPSDWLLHHLQVPVLIAPATDERSVRRWSQPARVA